MGKIYSNNPIFVDLFYGVVVGSAVALLSVTDVEKLLFQCLWILAVLEDWFGYYTFVVDTSATRVPYTFKSLMIEFLILLSWFLGFQTLKEENQESKFLFFYSMFYTIKLLAGVSFYAKHRQLASRRMAYDCIWLVLLIMAGLISYYNLWPEFSDRFLVISGTTFAILSMWWILKLFGDPNRPKTP